MDLRKFFEELLVVIVLYKTRPEQSAAFTSLQTALDAFPSFPEIFIYDNSPESSSVSGFHITYFHDPANSGVSRAYNHASAVASDKKKKWMLLLDQDTSVKKVLFEDFLDAITTHPESVAFVPIMKDRNGFVSPFSYRGGRGRRITTLQDKYPLDKFRFINSGLLIHHSAFVMAGGYCERIPIDFSDISFGERLMTITNHFIVIDTLLDHAFSGTQKLPLAEAVTRFHHFCTGAFVMAKNSGSFVYFIRASLRALSLCIQYKKLHFLTIFLKRISR